MIEAGQNVVALDHVEMIQVFKDGNLMVEQSLSSFAFNWLIFYQLDGNCLLIEFVNPQINLTETAFSDRVRPSEEILLYFFDRLLTLTIIEDYMCVLLVHFWLNYTSLNLALI